MINKSDVRKQVEESNYEARRKRRIIVFNREEEVVDVVRMRKKKGEGLARSISVELKSEYDKWTVLKEQIRFAGNEYE